MSSVTICSGSGLQGNPKKKCRHEESPVIPPNPPPIAIPSHTNTDFNQPIPRATGQLQCKFCANIDKVAKNKAKQVAGHVVAVPVAVAAEVVPIASVKPRDMLEAIKRRMQSQ